MAQLLFFGLAYLMGSIPTAVWYGRYVHGIDIKQHGSGNAGATNSLRVLGKKAGVIVLLIDVLKGFLVVYLFESIYQDSFMAFLVGIFAILGHIFPVFSNFKGGKGIATSLGVILAVFPLGAAVCIVVFILTVWLSKYVSLASLLASFVFCVLLTYQYFEVNLPLVAVGWGLFLLLAYMHRTNITKLLLGTENKIGQTKKD
jgi:acyl phosphate:glycerol-3-phosphate acyltransferase